MKKSEIEENKQEFIETLSLFWNQYVKNKKLTDKNTKLHLEYEAILLQRIDLLKAKVGYLEKLAGLSVPKRINE